MPEEPPQPNSHDSSENRNTNKEKKAGKAPSHRQACERVNKLLPWAIRFSRSCAWRYNFRAICLDESDAVSEGLFKFWQLAQTFHAPPERASPEEWKKNEDEFARYSSASIRHAISSLRSKTKVRDIRFRDPPKTKDLNSGKPDSKTAEGTSGISTDDFIDEEHIANESTFESELAPEEDIFDEESQEESDSLDDPEDLPNDDDYRPDAGAVLREAGQCLDADLVSCELSTEGLVFTDTEEDRAHRVRTSLVFHAILNEREAKKFDRWLPENYQSMIRDTDLLTEAEQFVLKEYGSGTCARKVVEHPDAKKYDIQNVNQVYTLFNSAYKHMWEILLKLGFQWIDMHGAFRGRSLREEEAAIAFLAVRNQIKHPADFTAALFDLYASVSPELFDATFKDGKKRKKNPGSTEENKGG